MSPVLRRLLLLPLMTRADGLPLAVGRLLLRTRRVTSATLDPCALCTCDVDCVLLLLLLWYGGLTMSSLCKLFSACEQV